MGIKYLHFIRHGQYHMDKKEKRYGSLTALGRQQARYVAKRLKDFSYDTVFASTMKRAIETATIATKKLDIEKFDESDLLREGIPCLPSKTVREKKLDPTKFDLKKKQMDEAYDTIFTDNQSKTSRHQLYFCHGNIIRYFCTKALSIDENKWLDFDIYQCSLTTFTIDKENKLRLEIFGEIGHIPLEKRTFI